jgi:meso-butanediol dehydrogenase / (S,S)-butanediol dehydrogenase / diacetyl reductase
MTLKGKVAVVTGAGRGIGKASAIALAQAGADVALIDIDAAAAEASAAAIAALGRRSLAVRADLGELAQIDGFVDQTVQALGGIDILVNNAALTQHGKFLEVTEATWDRLHRVNAKGAFFCAQRVARQMAAQGRGGRIINIASIAGKGYAQTSNPAYAASKGAVISMTYIAAHQLAEHDIAVNAICPGVVLTPLLDGMLAERAEQTGLSVDELKERMCRPIPIGRANLPEDIAAMVVFLAGPGARNITGQTINVDGGLIMH